MVYHPVTGALLSYPRGGIAALDAPSREALASAVEARGALVVAATAGVSLPTLYAAMRGAPVRRQTRAALVAALAREATPRAA